MRRRKQTTRTNVSTTAVRGIEERIFLMLLFACCACVALYIYFIGSSVLHVVMRKEAIVAINTLSAEISKLETQYLVSLHTVTPAYAASLGFVAVENKQFTNRASVTARVDTSGE